MSVAVRKAHADDMKSIIPKTMLDDAMIMRGVQQIAAGNSYTGISDDGIVWICGMVNLWGRVNQAWLLPAELVNKYPKSFHKGMKRIIQLWLEDSDRLQITVSAENETELKWAQNVGFKIEGLMVNYGIGGDDQYMMAIT
ncbi:MAG: hypothetical protein IME93_03185 [Proteobacteria bacterium]|nr:hypothetical protein [Pseudomonadota bacterium]